MKKTSAAARVLGGGAALAAWRRRAHRRAIPIGRSDSWWPSGGRRDRRRRRLLMQRVGEMLGQPDRGREQAGCRRQYRLRDRRRRQARRLHAAGRQFDHEHRAGALRQAGLRSGEGPRRRRAFHHGADDHPGAGGRREDDRGTGSDAAQGAGQALLSVTRQRQPDPYQQPAVLPARRPKPCTCPIAARRRRRRTRWPDVTPSRSMRWAASRASSMPAGSPCWRLRGEAAAPLPDVPTVQEKLGFPFNVSTWNMIFAPAGTPRPIVDKLNATINEAIRNPELIEKASRLEIEFVQSTPRLGKGLLRAADGVLGADREGVRRQGGIGRHP